MTVTSENLDGVRIYIPSESGISNPYPTRLTSVNKTPSLENNPRDGVFIFY
jgi:hypothetical protein